MTVAFCDGNHDHRQPLYLQHSRKRGRLNERSRGANFSGAGHHRNRSQSFSGHIRLHLHFCHLRPSDRFEQERLVDTTRRPFRRTSLQVLMRLAGWIVMRYDRRILGSVYSWIVANCECINSRLEEKSLPSYWRRLPNVTTARCSTKASSFAYRTCHLETASLLTPTARRSHDSAFLWNWKWNLIQWWGFFSHETIKSRSCECLCSHGELLFHCQMNIHPDEPNRCKQTN